MKTEPELSNETCLKWLALFEILYLIEKECEKHNYSFNYTVNKNLKPNHIKEYIQDRYHQLEKIFDTGRVRSENEFIVDFLYGTT